MPLKSLLCHLWQSGSWICPAVARQCIAVNRIVLWPIPTVIRVLCDRFGGSFFFGEQVGFRPIFGCILDFKFKNFLTPEFWFSCKGSTTLKSFLILQYYPHWFVHGIAQSSFNQCCQCLYPDLGWIRFIKRIEDVIDFVLESPSGVWDT